MDSQTNTTNSEKINLNLPEEGPIGVFVSGGADSAMLLYLVTQEVKRSGRKIDVHPMTAERLGRPFNLRHAQRVKEEVQRQLDFEFGLHYCYMIPSHQKGFRFEEALQVNSHYAHEFSSRFQLKKLYFAHTQPIEGQEGDNQVFATPGLSEDLIEKPLQDFNKTHIASLYHQLGLLDSLFAKTRSCEADLLESDYFRKVCAEIDQRTQPCVGCQEREFAFRSFL